MTNAEVKSDKCLKTPRNLEVKSDKCWEILTEIEKGQGWSRLIKKNQEKND